ncbi:MAG: hypothetical protein IJP78_13585 [Clostridia bacterium]|nr:hypothetical protein [Clostridia bacterium]
MKKTCLLAQLHIDFQKVKQNRIKVKNIFNENEKYVLADAEAPWGYPPQTPTKGLRPLDSTKRNYFVEKNKRPPLAALGFTKV